MYYFSNGKVKTSTNKQFSNIKNNYEISFDTRSEIKECFEGSDIKQQSYSIVPIAMINNKEANDIIDVIGIVKHASEVAEIISTKLGGKQLQKRDLTLIDTSGADIRLTLWGDKALQEPVVPWSEQPIVAFKGVKVGDFGGRSLTVQNSSTMLINPPSDMLPEVLQLHEWRYSMNGNLVSNFSLSSGGGAGIHDKGPIRTS